MLATMQTVRESGQGPQTDLAGLQPCGMGIGTGMEGELNPEQQTGLVLPKLAIMVALLE